VFFDVPTSRSSPVIVSLGRLLAVRIRVVGGEAEVFTDRLLVSQLETLHATFWR